jgi:hypothetical protein
MPIHAMLVNLYNVLSSLKTQVGAYSNKSTGLHIGISLPGQNQDTLDYVKLALFLGDEYVLQQFGRQSNSYARSSLNAIRRTVADHTSIWDIQKVAANMRAGMMKSASEIISMMNRERTVTINMKSGYVEFRSAGNDYMADFAKLRNTVLRYANAYAVAMDPTAYRQEYAKKLMKLVNPENNDELRVFMNYVSGANPDKNALKRILANRQGKDGNPNLQIQRPPAPKLPADPVKPNTPPAQQQ